MNASTQALVHIEVFILQLVFDHTLRIRLTRHSEDSNVHTGSSTGVTGVITPKPPASGLDQDSRRQADQRTFDIDGEWNKVAAGKRTASDRPKVSTDTDTLVGKVNNLVTTDLRHIVEARNLVQICGYFFHH